MTGNARPGTRILGSLRSADGKGVVRMQDRFDTSIDDLWSALTDPRRLARWLGEVEGDLRLGGEFRARFFDGWEGAGRVEACEPPRRLLVATKHHRQTDEQVIEAMLAADGDQTILVWEERGMPLNLLAAYGAGIQVHVENLAAHLAGRERCDGEARWNADQALVTEQLDRTLHGADRDLVLLAELARGGEGAAGRQVAGPDAVAQDRGELYVNVLVALVIHGHAQTVTTPGPCHVHLGHAGSPILTMTLYCRRL
jgi:uncharacterized protein YndB with AHSA1/START domain